MPQWYEAFESGNVELETDWTVQDPGLHIHRALSDRAGGHWVNWLRGDNVPSTFGSKTINCEAPSPSQDLNVSVEWKFIHRFGYIDNSVIRFYCVSNVPVAWPVPGGLNGYVLLIQTLAGGFIRFYRADPGLATVIGVAGYTVDLDEHEFKITREVEGANRWWRLYMDGVLLGGPVNDATYNINNYLGIAIDERDQVGEILISS